MKTIEQLADEYVGHPYEIDEFSSVTIKRQAFIDGARAQRSIDNEKICYRRKGCGMVSYLCARFGTIVKKIKEAL